MAVCQTPEPACSQPAGLLPASAGAWAQALRAQGQPPQLCTSGHHCSTDTWRGPCAATVNTTARATCSCSGASTQCCRCRWPVTSRLTTDSPPAVHLRPPALTPGHLLGGEQVPTELPPTAPGSRDQPWGLSLASTTYASVDSPSGCAPTCLRPAPAFPSVCPPRGRGQRGETPASGPQQLPAGGDQVLPPVTGQQHQAHLLPGVHPTPAWPCHWPPLRCRALEQSAGPQRARAHPGPRTPGARSRPQPSIPVLTPITTGVSAGNLDHHVGAHHRFQPHHCLPRSRATGPTQLRSPTALVTTADPGVLTRGTRLCRGWAQ